MEPLWPLCLADRNNDADHGLKTHVMTFANGLQLWKGWLQGFAPTQNLFVFYNWNCSRISVLAIRLSRVCSIRFNHVHKKVMFLLKDGVAI